MIDDYKDKNQDYHDFDDSDYKYKPWPILLPGETKSHVLALVQSSH